MPFGIYDLADNVGWVSVGTDHDTASFAVNAIRRWWIAMGKGRYAKAKRLMITADGGGSNGYRVRLWKVEIQKLADELKFPITVGHFPPGTSKWNKVEHRLFSFISINWRGKPLRTYRTIVQLIAATTTDAGRAGRVGSKQIPEGRQGLRRAIRRRQPLPSRFPWRLELHHRTAWIPSGQKGIDLVIYGRPLTLQIEHTDHTAAGRYLHRRGAGRASAYPDLRGSCLGTQHD